MPSSLTPEIIDITIYQGADWALTYTWTDDGDPVDLTGYHARMQIKKDWSKGTRPYITLGDESPLSGLSIQGEGPGTIPATMTATETEELPATDEQLWVYDLRITDPAGKVSRLVQGTVTVSPRVTAPA